MLTPRTDEQFRVHFWAQCKRMPNGCLEWQRSRKPDGYGHVGWRNKPWSAHRASWTLTHGPIPEGMNVLHSCDNPPCCDPGHLHLGNQKMNMQECWARSRGKHGGGKHDGIFGENNPRSKLTEAVVREIRSSLGAISGGEWGRRLGVTKNAISAVRRGLVWKHVLP